MGTTDKPTIVIPVELTADEAWELAQLVKRIGWSELRSLSMDDAEARGMRTAVERLGKTLAEHGFAPR